MLVHTRFGFCGVALTLLLLTGCGMPFRGVRGSGSIASEMREVRDFTRIAVIGSGTVRLEQTGTESLAVEAEDNILPLLVTTVENGTLKLATKGGVNIYPTRPIVYHVTATRIDSLDISGSGSIETGTLKAESLTVRISGSGNFRADAIDTTKLVARISGSGGVRVGRVEARQLKCNISGSGNVRLAGRGDEVELDISGSGSMHAADLQCRNADVAIAGSGNATIHATETLTANVSGSGSVRYRGKPGALNTHFSGSGSVTNLPDAG
jgi:hypothetical protein